MYWPASWFLADAARKEYRDSPDGLFVTSCFYNFLALSILGLLFFMGLFDRSNSLDVLPKLLVWLGWVGWISVGLYPFVGGHDRTDRRPVASPQKLQCWMNDLLAAALFFGVAMIPSSMLLGETYFSDFTEAIIWSAAYLLVCMLLGLLIALDLLRHTARPYGPRVRFAVVLAVIFYAALSLLLGCFFAWITWKRAVREPEPAIR